MAHALGSRLSLPEQKLVWRQVYPSRSRRDVLRFATVLKCKKVDVFTFLDQKITQKQWRFCYPQKKQDEEMQLLADALHPSVPILPPLPAPPGAKSEGAWTVMFGPVKIHS